MKFWFGFIIAVLMHFGCKSATGVDATSKSISANAADRRIMSKGVMRLKTTYTLDSNQFSSTCAAVLIHTPEPSLNYCVAITAAHCFRHIPDYAQHSLEIIDGKGDILKSHRVSEVTVHPEFTATDAAQTFEQAASDVALLEFKCALPEAIQPALVLDVSAVTSDAKFFTTKFMAVKTEQKSGPMDTLIDRLLGHEPMSTFPIYLFQSPVELLSVDFPGGNSGSQLSSSTGVLNLSNPSENDVCSGDAGAPAFAQIGQETYLIATASSGTGFCDKEKLLYSITSSHAKWINKTLETEVVVPRTSPEPTISAEKMTESKTKKLDSKVLDLSGKEEYLVKKIPSPVAIEAPTLTIPSPVAASSLPKPLPTVRPQSAKHQAKKAKVISPPRIATPAPAEEDESAP
ncbi:hypothetical protein EBR21_11120, partial [bacterium]|nr:hypothetical protein [bacterium]